MAIADTPKTGVFLEIDHALAERLEFHPNTSQELVERVTSIAQGSRRQSDDQYILKCVGFNPAGEPFFYYRLATFSGVMTGLIPAWTAVPDGHGTGSIKIVSELVRGWCPYPNSFQLVKLRRPKGIGWLYPM